MRIDPVCRVLDAIAAPYALIGAHAMAARGYPRFTVDVDLLTTDPRVLERETWSPLTQAGAVVEPRRGDQDDPLAGVVHILLADGTDVDVVLGRWKWESDIIARAETLTVAEGVRIRVPRTADLILLKLAAGGFMDLRDAAALIEVAGRDVVVQEVESRIDEVCPDVRAAWTELLASSR
jgi:hypothetical protein